MLIHLDSSFNGDCDMANWNDEVGRDWEEKNSGCQERGNWLIARRDSEKVKEKSVGFLIGGPCN